MAVELTNTLQNLGIALGLGLLVGLQRERAASELAGFRTFPLVTVLGVLCGILDQGHGRWLTAASLLALAALVTGGNLLRRSEPRIDPGLTTEVALLVMFCVGAYLVDGHRSVAVVVGGAVAVLLYLKPQLHQLARRIGDADFHAMMQFVVISLVILPVLPDQAYGPYAVLNPHRIWWLVVLIVGISLGGYVVYKLFGNRVGIAVAGLLGGLISSTATTVSYSRRTREGAPHALAAIVILLASAVVFLRVLAIIGATHAPLLRAALPPLGLLLLVSAALAAILWTRSQHQTLAMPTHGNPSELKSALLFALLFAVVLLATALGQASFGDRGLYGVAALSGLTDMDAITLSTTQMVRSGRIPHDTAWRVIVVATLANLVFKAGIVAVVAGRPLLRRITLLFGVIAATGVALLAFL